MDKRTLIFVFSLVLALFGVNIFFEQQRTSSMREWNEQQAGKKTEKLAKLEKEIDSRTATLDSLPLATLFADAQLTQPLSTAVKGGEAYLTLAWQKELPKQVYIRDINKEGKGIRLTLANEPEESGSPVIYRASSSDKLRTDAVQELGRYDLQLLMPSPSREESIVLLGEYADGQVTLPGETAAALKKAIGSETGPFSLRDAVALVKTKSSSNENSFLPVAIFRAASKRLEWLDAFPGMDELTLRQKSREQTTPQRGEETFYLLETPYQQLLFSNKGAALAEINLPFQTAANRESVVKEIGFDREMAVKHPYNARFPAHPYYTPAENGGTEWVKHEAGRLGGYYPLLRRDLIEKEKKHSILIPPRYYALNIVSDYPETAETLYEVKSFTKDSITFEAVLGHRRITKTYSVANESEAPYSIDLTIQIEGDSRGLWLTSGIPEVEWISGNPAPVLKYRITRNQKSEIETIELPKNVLTVTTSHPDWVCNSNGFLGLILDPLNEIDPGYRAVQIPGTSVPSRLVEIDQEYQRFNAASLPGYMVLLPLKNSSGTVHFRIFAGPFSTAVLKKVDSVYSNPSTGYNPDYIACQSFHGWFSFISEPFAKFLFVLMNFFHTLTGSWALSIVLLTVALRVMLWPLNAWSTKSMVAHAADRPGSDRHPRKIPERPKESAAGDHESLPRIRRQSCFRLFPLIDSNALFNRHV